MRNFLCFILLSFILVSCQGQDCTKLPSKFTSYEQALKLVKGSKFKLKESTSTASSSWITSTKYYSCDGETGYFIFTANGREYIHLGMPLEVWKGFKATESKGTFYNQYIKGRYILQSE